MKAIFVIASPRSGTTMLGSMLGANTKCIALPESPFIASYYYEYFSCGKRVSGEALSKRIVNYYRFKHWRLHDERLLKARRTIFDKTRYREFIETLVTKYALNEGKRHPSFWVEHSPSNIRYFVSLAELFPDSQFIHLIRDGRAVASSIIPLDWGANNAQEAAHQWLEDLAFGFSAELTLGKTRCMRIKYEDIVENPREQLQKICEFIGLTFEKQMVKGSGLRLPIYTRRQHNLVGSPPKVDRINAWKKELTKRQIKLFEDIAGSMLKGLGYDTCCDLKPSPPSFIERMFLNLVATYRREFLNRIRMKRRRRLSDIE